MRQPARLAALLIATIVAVAACQSASPSPASPRNSLPVLGSPGTSPAATLPPFPTVGSSVPAATPGQSSGPASPRPPGSVGSPAAVTPFHAVAALEQIIPTQAGGRTLTVESVAGPTFQDGNGTHKVGLRCRWYSDRGLRCRDQQELVAALGALGKTPADAVVAVGYNLTKNQEIEVQALRVGGIGGEALRDAVLAVLRDGAAKRTSTLNSAPGTVGGKNVTVITYASAYPLGLKRYLYANDNTLFDVRRADDAAAAEILQALP
jgi:hypothetical protein